VLGRPFVTLDTASQSAHPLRMRERYRGRQTSWRAGFALAACFWLSACYLSHGLEPDVGPAPIDAARPDTSVVDSSVVDSSSPDAFVCAPGEPCDCLAEGTVSWPGVWYCAARGTLMSGSDGPTECGSLGAPWGGRVRIRARCRGRYRFCARVESFGGCTVIDDICSSGRLSDDSGRATLSPPPGWATGNDCTSQALYETGGQTCVRISWETESGDRGSRELGCLAPFGPVGSGGGGGGSFGGDSGEWSF